MACPLFEPTEKLPWTRWEGRYRPPLGALYHGRCHANDAPAPPPEGVLTDCCNMGYARGRCPRFVEAEADAARFEIRELEADAATVRWLTERDCLPVDLGERTLRRTAHGWSCDGEVPLPQRRQLEAFLEALGELGEGG